MSTAADRFAKNIRAALDLFEGEQAAAEAQAANVHPGVQRIIEAATVRREWKKIEAEMPEIIAQACAAPNWNPQTVASVLDVTDSYVYRKLREQRAAQQ